MDTTALQTAMRVTRASHLDNEPATTPLRDNAEGDRRDFPAETTARGWPERG